MLSISKGQLVKNAETLRYGRVVYNAHVLGLAVVNPVDSPWERLEAWPYNSLDLNVVECGPGLEAMRGR